MGVPSGRRRNRRGAWFRRPWAVFVSVVLHGIPATPVMRLLDRFNERTQQSQSVTEAP
jgi:hypothetical protein